LKRLAKKLGRYKEWMIMFLVMIFFDVTQFTKVTPINGTNFQTLDWIAIGNIMVVFHLFLFVTTYYLDIFDAA